MSAGTIMRHLALLTLLAVLPAIAAAPAGARAAVSAAAKTRKVQHMHALHRQMKLPQGMKLEAEDEGEDEDENELPDHVTVFFAIGFAIMALFAVVFLNLALRSVHPLCSFHPAAVLTRVMQLQRARLAAARANDALFGVLRGVDLGLHLLQHVGQHRRHARGVRGGGGGVARAFPCVVPRLGACAPVVLGNRCTMSDPDMWALPGPGNNHSDDPGGDRD
eukprot:1001198-Rhodomonas_salina.2